MGFNLSILAVSSLVFSSHPTPIASVVYATDDQKKGHERPSSDAIDTFPRDESGASRELGISKDFLVSGRNTSLTVNIMRMQRRQVFDNTAADIYHAQITVLAACTRG
jgi:hypothetical protein